MSFIKRFVVKLSNNKWVQILLLVIAPFILTPKEFIAESINRKSFWRKIPLIAAGFSASGFFALMLISSIPYIVPDFPFRYQGEGLAISILTAISFIMIILLSTTRWSWNWIVFHVSKSMSYSANRAEFSYYWITSSSYIVWIGVFCLAAAVLSSGMPNGFTGVFSILNDKPWILPSFLVFGALLQRRQRAISAETEMILYPSWFAKLINFLPAFLVIIVTLLASLF